MTKRIFTTHPDAKKLIDILPSIKNYQMLADKHGIKDIFQDNGGKLLQILLCLGLKLLPGRTGNDAIDEDGNEYEIKTLNSKISTGFSTNHHINESIISKYRSAKWIFAVFENIEMKKIYYCEPILLDTFFRKWTDKCFITESHINNPKIPLQNVEKYGHLIWSDQSI